MSDAKNARAMRADAVLAREWAEGVVEAVVKGPDIYSFAQHAAARFILDTTTPPTMDDLDRCEPTASFVPDGREWLLDGPTGPVVWTAPGGLVMIQRIEPGELTPEKAREFATHIHFAAYHAEK